MNIVCVIPARAESSRFFEKPLALILGKPMLQWVYDHCCEVKEFSKVVVATDSDKIRRAAESFGAEVMMTSDKHDTATERLYEVSTNIEADLYVMVNGGEPVLIRVVGLNDENRQTKIKALTAIVDVPDEMEHFNDLQVPTSGLTLPVSVPNYYTTAVRIDAIQNTGTNPVMVQIVSRTPCVIKLLNASGTVVAGTVDVTWQGYRRNFV